MKKILIFSLLFLGFILLNPQESKAYGECSEYGYMATYDTFSRTCSCMSGYVFQDDVLGNPQCVSATSVCNKKLGYNSRYNSLSNSCECSYGYVLGKDSIGRTQCVSKDSMCEDQLGYNSSYDLISGNCKCNSGYVIDKYGQCSSGTLVCTSKHGLHSSYTSFDNKCSCDSGYTFDSNNQCVEKQNNVYFTLKEINESSKEAIVRSDYDNRYYKITYGIGCLSFNRYQNKKIVINLGTDFDLDTWDTVVLQDDDETCNITSKQKVDSTTTLFEEEDDVNYYYTPTPVKSVTQTQPKVVTPTQKQSEPIPKKEIAKSTPNTASSTTDSIIATNTPVVNTQTNEIVKKDGWFKRFWKMLFGISN